MKGKEGYRFSWSNFIEGISWALFSAMTFGGLGASGIHYRNNSPDNLWLGLFLIVLGIVVTVFCVIMSFEMAWVKKD